VDFFRVISITHCNEFDMIKDDIKLYLFNTQLNNRLAPSGNEKDFCQITGIEQKEIFNNSGITNNLSDTTLSIIRKGYSVNQNGDNRISPSINGIKMLHIGYLESNFYSKNSLEVIEMLIYSRNRHINLSESKTDYLNRYIDYTNLIKSTNEEIYNYFIYLLGRT